MSNNLDKYIFLFLMFLIIIVLVDYYIGPKDSSSEQIKITTVDRDDNIYRFHDDEMNVTCWLVDYNTVSVPPTISCISDSQLGGR